MDCLKDGPIRDLQQIRRLLERQYVPIGEHGLIHY